MSIVAITTIPILLMLAPGYVLFDIQPSDVLRDARSVMQAPFYVGLISDLGILLWAASAAISFFTYFFLKKYGHSPELPRFFLFAGLFTLFLLIDDWLLLHESMGRLIGIGERFLFAIYGLSMLSYLFFFRRQILQSNYSLLVIALGLFAVSLIIDRPVFKFYGRIVVEDGAKFIGIATWLAYFAHMSRQSIYLEFSENFPGKTISLPPENEY